MTSSLKIIFQNLILAAIGLILGCLVTVFARENPIEIARIIVVGAFGSSYDFGLTLYFTAILTFTGLAVSIPFRAGLFNIGGEGQLNVACLAAAASSAAIAGMASTVTVYTVVGVTVIGVLVGGVAGGLWSGLCGWIRAYRGGHEVISTIMMNFIAGGLTSWLVTAYLQSPESQSPVTTPVAESLLWPRSFNGAPVSWVLLFIPLICGLIQVGFHRSRLGFSMKATASNETAAALAGINIKKTRFVAMLLGGACAGVAGAIMVFQDAGQYRVEMGSGFGFMGIPVALLGEGHPVGVLLSAFLFAFLYQGSSALDIEASHVGRDLAQVIQAIVVVVVISKVYFNRHVKADGKKRWFSIFK